MASILLIDDSADIRALVRLLLEQGGHRVSESADGHEGLRLAREVPHDLILTDVAMPGHSGQDVLRALKADPGTTSIPVVALTAFAMKGDRERFLSSGFDGFVSKPIDVSELDGTIASLLSTHHPRGDAAEPGAPMAEGGQDGVGIASVFKPMRRSDEPDRRILVVDDNPDVLALLRQFLTAEGFETTFAADGPSALSAVERDAPDLVLLDVMLPALNGYEVARRIKARPGAPFLPVVLVTAGTLDRERGLHAGADDFLGKPIERVELIARVRSLLRLRAAILEGRRQAEELRRLDRTKERFIATVAHDLRTPLNAMGLTIEMLQIAPDDPGEREAALSVLGQNVRQMGDLLSGLLDYSQLVAGEQPLSLDEFDPRDLAREVADSLAATAASRSLDLRRETIEGLPSRVISDYAKCRQVAFNLGSNALKFTGAGHVTFRTRPEGPGFWAIDVADSGVGIAEEDHEAIFEEFAQARVGRPADAPGTGLGLAISRRLTERLGGRLTVTSELGRGSTFTASWPVRPEVRRA